VRGAVWIVLSCLLFAMMGATAKFLGQRLDSFQVAFARALMGLLVVSPVFFRQGWGLWRTNRRKAHILRGILGACGMMSGFYALAHLPLAEVTAIQFSKPLFMVILAAVTLGEIVKRRRWTATLIGFVGVLIMLRPGTEALQLAGIVALAGAFFASCVAIMIRSLMRTENRSTSLAYLGLVVTIITAIPAYLVWQPPTVFEIFLMGMMGVVGTLSQICMMQGYKLGEASALAVFDYVRLPFALIIGYLIFAELPGVQALIGSAIIIGATLYIARREAHLEKAGQATVKPRVHE
jgi:drug/metabolite transporter (DMT)-like permease